MNTGYRTILRARTAQGPGLSTTPKTVAVLRPYYCDTGGEVDTYIVNKFAMGADYFVRVNKNYTTNRTYSWINENYLICNNQISDVGYGVEIANAYADTNTVLQWL
jgi:hypothetical protein